MKKEHVLLIGLLALQVIAITLYPLSFFREAPQSIILPPTFALLFVLALLGMNTGVLTALIGRVSLVFVQGVNIVVRMMMLFPNLRTPEGNWYGSFIVTMLVSIGLSWYAIVQLENRPPQHLLLRKKGT
jgi:hypothetical protein